MKFRKKRIHYHDFTNPPTYYMRIYPKYFFNIPIHISVPDLIINDINVYFYLDRKSYNMFCDFLQIDVSNDIHTTYLSLLKYKFILIQPEIEKRMLDALNEANDFQYQYNKKRRGKSLFRYWCRFYRLKYEAIIDHYLMIDYLLQRKKPVRINNNYRIKVSPKLNILL